MQWSQGPGLLIWVVESRMIPKQETVTIFLNLYTRIPRHWWWGAVMPPLHLTKLGLIANAVVLPGGWESPQVVHLCHPTLREWERTGGGGICSTSSSARNLEQHRARLNLAFLPTGESLSKNKSQIEGEIVAEGKRTNKWALQQEDPVLH